MGLRQTGCFQVTFDPGQMGALPGPINVVRALPDGARGLCPPHASGRPPFCGGQSNPALEWPLLPMEEVIKLGGADGA